MPELKSLPQIFPDNRDGPFRLPCEQIVTGPSIEKSATDGDPKAFDLPRPLKREKNDDFSFSGLKTSVLYKVKGQNRGRSAPDAEDIPVADLAASAQEAIADVLSFKAVRACTNRRTAR